MKKVTLFIGSVLFLSLLTSCSEDQAVRPDLSATSTDNMLALGGTLSTPTLNLDFNPAFIARKEELKLEFAAQLKPQVEKLVMIGKLDLARYGVDPSVISDDPNDPRFAAMALLVGHLENLYAQGFTVKLVDGPVVDNNPEAYSPEVGCALEALGLKTIIEVVQSGAAGAGLTGEILVGTFFRIAVKRAIGFVGAAVMAYEFGTCLASLPYQQYTEDPQRLWADMNSTDPQVREWARSYLSWQMTVARENFVNAKGDTAELILAESRPITE